MVGGMLSDALQSLIGDLIAFLAVFWVPVLVSLLAALFTVHLTFWYHNRRDKRQALKAFQSELHLNDMETEMMIHDIFAIREGTHTDSEYDTRTSVRLSSSAYDTMKTTGTLEDMAYNAQESIRSYYTALRLINQSLEQREALQFAPVLPDQQSALADVDSRLLAWIHSICGPERLEMVADRLRGNEKVSEILRDRAEDKRGRELGEVPIYGDYDEVGYWVQKELDSMSIRTSVRQWINGLRAD